jgi:hypothetical protein
MAWVRLGRVYVPDGSQSWSREYASFPTVEDLPDGNLRIYFTSLDAGRCGSTGCVDVAFDDPTRIIQGPREPVLTCGAMGDFDECGANAFSVVADGSRRLLYYQGWQLTTRAPYLVFTGLAMAQQQDMPFRKLGRVPVMDRTEDEPYMRCSPYVIRDGDGFRMWYVSCTGWTNRDGAPQYFTQIRTASSKDGVAWGDGRVCLTPSDPEYALGRPCVLRGGDGYRMWFSIRSNAEPYRLGYAESRDGFSWTRLDHGEHVIRAAASGWDSEMVCYPFVIEREGRRLLFYNGNRHGATGFGVAEWR